jgi:hypothetical protein
MEQVDPMNPGEQEHTGLPWTTLQVPDPQVIKLQGLY